jgi:single stranded DNA-binding protein
MIEAAFTGRLARDAELRHVNGGELPLLSFSCAVEDNQAAPGAAPTWIRVAVFGDQAKQLAPRLTKGTKVYCEGKLRLEIFDGRDGHQRATLNVTAALCQPLGQIGRRRPRGAPSRRRVPAPSGASEPPAAWLTIQDAAIRDLTEGRGR